MGCLAFVFCSSFLLESHLFASTTYKMREIKDKMGKKAAVKAAEKKTEKNYVVNYIETQE